MLNENESKDFKITTAIKNDIDQYLRIIDLDITDLEYFKNASALFIYAYGLLVHNEGRTGGQDVLTEHIKEHFNNRPILKKYLDAIDQCNELINSAENEAFTKNKETELNATIEHEKALETNKRARKKASDKITALDVLRSRVFPFYNSKAVDREHDFFAFLFNHLHLCNASNETSLNPKAKSNDSFPVYFNGICYTEDIDRSFIATLNDVVTVSGIKSKGAKIPCREYAKDLYNRNLGTIRPLQIDYIAVNNGLIRFNYDKTQKKYTGFDFIDHDPAIMTFNALNVDYDESITDEQLEAFKKDILSPYAFDDETQQVNTATLENIIEAFAICLRLDNGFKIEPVFQSQAHGGKSKLLELLEDIIGSSNCEYVSLANFENQFATARLKGKRLNISAEIIKGALKPQAVERLKRITGGDKIDIERKGVDAYPYKPRFKTISACNDVPATTDPAMIARWYFVILKHRFDNDPSFSLVKDEYKKLMFRLMLNAYLEMLNRNKNKQSIFTYNPVSEAFKNEFVIEHDAMSAWIAYSSVSDEHFLYVNGLQDNNGKLESLYKPTENKSDRDKRISDTALFINFRNFCYSNGFSKLVTSLKDSVFRRKLLEHFNKSGRIAQWHRLDVATYLILTDSKGDTFEIKTKSYFLELLKKIDFSALADFSEVDQSSTANTEEEEDFLQ